MVNSYSAPSASYGYQAVTNVPANNTPIKRRTSIPYVLGGLALGSGVGAAIGWESNPFISKKGEVMDDFAQKTLDIFMKKTDDSTKKIYKGSINILEGLKKVKTTNDLKNLLNNNKDFAEEMCKGLKQTPDEYIKTITIDNLEANKDAITAQINGANKNKLQSIKNQIQACWDKTTNSFKKNKNVSQDTFDSINEATKGYKNKFIGKYALIGGLGTALVTFLTYHLIKAIKTKKQTQKIAQKNVQAQNINIQ